MSAFHWLLAVCAVIGAAMIATFRKYYMPVEQVEPITPKPTPPMPTDPDATSYPWDSQKHNYHNVRVLCDGAGLSLTDKNIICACIYQESTFLNYLLNGQPVKCVNKNKDGSVASTDWGICQINDHYHIGAKLDFPSVDFVMANPDKAVAFMLSMFKAGELKQWVSYSSGAYEKWLEPTSPMWALAS